MAKAALKLNVQIPNFQTNSKAWRQAIHAGVAEAYATKKFRYSEDEKLEVEICFYLKNPKLTILDLDNRVKDVFDALQGFMFDKGKGGLKPIIPNDNQIYRLIVEKRLPPKAYLNLHSTIIIRRYDHNARTAASARDTRKHAARSTNSVTPLD